MRRLVFALFICGVLVLGGCGDDDGSPPPPPPARILSNASLDGDIAWNSVTNIYTVTQGGATQGIVKVGIDPVYGEYRGFLDFPLGGSNGVPLNAIISWATLELSITNILFNSLSDTLPIRIDLVPFNQSLTFIDFNSAPFASMTVTPVILQDDLGMFVRIDVTPLMVDAQNLAWSDFQVRIIRLQGAPYDLLEINDTDLPPLLEVGYF